MSGRLLIFTSPRRCARSGAAQLKHKQATGIQYFIFSFFFLFFLQQSQKWTDKSPSTNAEQKALSTSHNVPSSIAHSDGQSNWIKLRWLGASLQLLLFDMGFRCAASVNLARLERLADTLIFYTKLWAAVPMSHWP